MPNNPLTQAELTAYTSNTLYPQIPAGYFFASPPTGAGPLAYRLFDASYISIGIINPNRLGTGSTGAGNLYLADNGTWKSITLATPTLAQVTTAGNTTTNSITVGGLVAATNLIYTDTVNSRVGIGTTSPTRTLTVNGPIIIPNNSGYYTKTTGGSELSVFIADTSNNVQIGSIFFGGGQINYTSTLFDWYNYPSSVLTHRMRLTASGNLLIGTTTDSGYRLNVNGTTRFIGDSYVSSGDLLLDNDRPIRWKDSGGTFRRAMLITAANDFQFGPVDTGWAGQTYLKAGGSINFLVNGSSGTSIYAGSFSSAGNFIVDTDTLFVDATNNRVGVGTTSPNYKVDVQGTTLAASSVSVQGGFNISRVAAPSGTITLTASSGGSVDVGQHQYFITYTTAIGETTKGSNANITVVSGSQTVTITGIPVSTDPRVTGRKIYRTRAGQTADRGALLATIADNTTTSYVDTVADSTLANIGDWASYRENTTSRYIMVDGSRAMLLGSQVTILGIGAGAALTEAGLGVLIGTNAGQSLTSGFSSTFIGHSAGRAVTTGQNNISIGPQSTWNTTTGNGNIVIGPGGLFFNTTGGDNIAIGSYTLEGSSGNSHSFNVAIGPAALYKLGAANNNVAIGYHSGRYISNGSNNTLSSNSVFIGYDTRPNANSETNQIVIGYNGRGLGSNTTVLGNSSTTFTSIPAGNMTIGGTTNAGYKLDVQGTTIIQSNLTVSSDIIVGTDNITNAWIAYTPIWSSQGGTQPNLGDGTLTGFYKKIGKTVFVRVKLNFGLTTTGGDGAWLFSLPVNAASQDGIQFPCSMLDNGFAWYQGIVNGTYSGFTDKSAIIAQSPGGANSSQGVSGAFPFGWGNGDSLQFNGSYECI